MRWVSRGIPDQSDCKEKLERQGPPVLPVLKEPLDSLEALVGLEGKDLVVFREPRDLEEQLDPKVLRGYRVLPVPPGLPDRLVFRVQRVLVDRRVLREHRDRVGSLERWGQPVQPVRPDLQERRGRKG